jgi:hypothetical protein
MVHERRIAAVLHLHAAQRSIDRHMAAASRHSVLVLRAQRIARARHSAAVLVRQELHILPTLRARHHPAAPLLVVPSISQVVLVAHAGHDRVRRVQAVIHAGRKNFVIIYPAAT